MAAAVQNGDGALKGLRARLLRVPLNVQHLILDVVAVWAEPGQHLRAMQSGSRSAIAQTHQRLRHVRSEASEQLRIDTAI